MAKKSTKNVRRQQRARQQQPQTVNVHVTIEVRQRVSMEEADAIIQHTQWAEMIEDYEPTRQGHSYSLVNGDSVLVRWNGSVEYFPA